MTQPGSTGPAGQPVQVGTREHKKHVVAAQPMPAPSLLPSARQNIPLFQSFKMRRSMNFMLRRTSERHISMIQIFETLGRVRPCLCEQRSCQRSCIASQTSSRCCYEAALALSLLCTAVSCQSPLPSSSCFYFTLRVGRAVIRERCEVSGLLVFKIPPSRSRARREIHSLFSDLMK